MKRIIFILVFCFLFVPRFGEAQFIGGGGGGGGVTETIPCGAGCSPTGGQLTMGPVLTNYGQAAADISVTLPAAGPGMSFMVKIETTQAGNSFVVTSAETGNMDVDDSVTVVNKNYVGFAAGQVTAKNGFMCMTIRTGAATYSWLCYGRKGTLTTN